MGNLVKKIGRDSLEFTKTGIVLGMGSSLSTGNPYVQQGIDNLSKGLPAVGSIKSAGYVLGGLKGFDSKKKGRF